MWVAKYRDGSVLTQISKGDEQPFDSIPRNGLWYVEIIDHNTAVVASYEYYPGMMPFYRRRVSMTPGQEAVVMHILGSRQLIEGQMVTNACFVYENTLRVEVGDFRKEGERKLRHDENRHTIAFHPADDVPVTI